MNEEHAMKRNTSRKTQSEIPSGATRKASGRRVWVQVRLYPKTLAVVDRIAAVWTREHCNPVDNSEPYTREHILQECITRGLVLEEWENLGTNTTNPHEPEKSDPLDPVKETDCDAYTELMLALLAAAKELTRKKLRAHDDAERTTGEMEWGPTQEDFNRARQADHYAEALLAEHERMVTRRWRAEQTPAQRADIKLLRAKQAVEQAKVERKYKRERAAQAQAEESEQAQGEGTAE